MNVRKSVLLNSGNPIRVCILRYDTEVEYIKVFDYVVKESSKAADRFGKLIRKKGMNRQKVNAGHVYKSLINFVIFFSGADEGIDLFD